MRDVGYVELSSQLYECKRKQQGNSWNAVQALRVGNFAFDF